MPQTIDKVLPLLGHFYGTAPEDLLGHRPIPGGPRVILTEGTQYVAREAGAFWLMDIFALKGRGWIESGDGMAVVKLDVASDSTARLTVTDGNDTVLYTERLDFTSFPAPGIKIWLEPWHDGTPVALLPTEH